MEMRTETDFHLSDGLKHLASRCHSDHPADLLTAITRGPSRPLSSALFERREGREVHPTFPFGVIAGVLRTQGKVSPSNEVRRLFSCRFPLQAEPYWSFALFAQHLTRLPPDVAERIRACGLEEAMQAAIKARMAKAAP